MLDIDGMLLVDAILHDENHPQAGMHGARECAPALNKKRDHAGWTERSSFEQDGSLD